MLNIAKNKTFLAFGFITTILIILNSCSSQRQTVYLRNADSTFIENAFLQRNERYTIKPQDVLYIDIKTFNEDLNKVVSKNNDNTSWSQQRNYDPSFMYSGYTVNNNGDIEMPLLGKFHLADLTLDQADSLIRKAVFEKVDDALVTVRMVSFRVTFLGETNYKGVMTLFRERVSIFDAIALAGDVTNDADKTNVLVVRTSTQGSQVTRLDLTDKNLLASESCYLKPDDMVIVQPRKTKIWRQNLGDYTFWLGTLTTTASTLVLLYSLITR